MDKEEFLRDLDKSLKRVPDEERRDILHDFEEHFAFGIEEGKTEEEIAESLGSPKQIAKEVNVSYHMDKVESTATTGNILRAVWAVIGLGFFNLVIVLGPFLGLAGVILGGWIASVVFTLSPLLVLVNTVIYPGTFLYFDFFFSLILSGAGLFIGIGVYFISRKLIDGFVKYMRYNVRLVKGGLKHV